MLTKTVECPKCKNKIKISGNHGEKVQIICPKCNTKGVFIFPENLAKSKHKILDESIAIEVKNLVKTYNGTKAVNNISFKIRKGEIFGFLGPNGAGKTTTIKSILGLVQINSGEIRINGVDVKNNDKEARRNVGYLPEKVAFYNNLTALQNLYFYAEIINAPKEQCVKLIEEFGLKDSINKKVGKFSKGMIQRLGMARALLGKPSILILDEPAGGLDPIGVKLVRDKIKEASKEGVTVFISSHILKEIQDICDRVGIINKGVIVAEDTLAELGKNLNLKPKLVIELEKVTDEIVNEIRKVDGVENVGVIGVMVHVTCDEKSKSKIILSVEKSGGNIKNLMTVEPSLEDVFMKYTGV